ncbi:DUF120 domain-containing protein [Nanoarchaeota archaeon]
MKRKLLLYLAGKTELFSELQTSTKELAKEIKSSQQSVSRLLQELEKQGQISRVSSPKGIKISLKQEAVENLQKDFITLKKIFQPERKLKGHVIQGFDEGKYYIEKYKSKIKQALGFEPFPGTLNIKTNPVKVKSFLMDINPIIIKPFTTKNRSFGSVELYKVKINGIEGAIIKPERTRHDLSVVELTTYIDLNEMFKVKQGKAVEITKY